MSGLSAPFCSGVAGVRQDPTGGKGRNQALDGLRGVAALSVAVGHCYLGVTGLALWGTSLRDFPHMTPAEISLRLVSTLFPNDAAVMAFFVLSGHVLWRSLGCRRPGFLDYVLARLLRLLPMTLVTTALIGLVAGAGVSEIIRNGLLFDKSLNGMLWSLQVEIIASVGLFVVWLVAGDHRWRLLALLIVSFALTPVFRGVGAVVFFPAFLLGASVDAIPERVARHWALLGGAILALLFANVVFGHGGVARVFEMLGATSLVAAVARGRFGFLRSRLGIFLGAISYPFYLSHLLGSGVAEHLADYFPGLSPVEVFAFITVVSVGLTVILAWLLHVFIEDPAMRLRPMLIARLLPVAKPAVAGAD